MSRESSSERELEVGELENGPRVEVETKDGETQTEGTFVTPEREKAYLAQIVELTKTVAEKNAEAAQFKVGVQVAEESVRQLSEQVGKFKKRFRLSFFSFKFFDSGSLDSRGVKELSSKLKQAHERELEQAVEAAHQAKERAIAEVADL